MRYFLLTIILFSCCFSSSGQSVAGKVISGKDNHALENATIIISTSDRNLISQTVTDIQGEFKFNTNITTFLCHISYVGFKDVQLTINNVDLKNIDLGDIIMNTDSTTLLKEIIVEANTVRDDIDKTVVFPTLRQVAISTSGIDLLKNLHLPGLFVDPVFQKVEIDGSSNVIYRINGITSSLKEIVALKADLIQRIEYSQTSSIRDLDSNSGLINVILKKQNSGTYLFANTIGAVTTGFLNGNTSLKKVYGYSEISLSYNVNWRDYQKRWSRESESYNSPKESVNYYKEGLNAPFGYLAQDIEISYIFNKDKNIFQAKILNSINSSFDRNYVDTYIKGQDNPLFFRNIHARNKTYLPSLDLYYIHKYDDKQGLELNLVGTIIESNYKRDLTDIYNSKKDYIYNSTDGNKKSFLFESFYYNKKSKVQYNIGLKGGYSKTDNKYYDNGRSNFKQFDLYPYISISGKIDNISYTLGSGLKVLMRDDENISKNYYRNLSTLSLFYKKNEVWNVRNVFRYTPSYPSLSSLNNIDQRQDSLMLVRGNNNMKPSQTIYNKLTFNYQLKNKFKVSISMNASKVFDAIGANYYYDININSFVTQNDNQDYSSALGASADISFPSILNIFDISSGVVWNKYKTKGTDFVHNLSDLYWYIFCNAKVKNFSFDVGYRKPSKSLNSQTVFLNENYSSIGMGYRKKNLSASSGIMFPFTSGTKYGSDRKSSIVPSSKSIYIKDNANMFYLNISYYISWGKSSSNINKSLNNSDYDSGITRISDN